MRLELSLLASIASLGVSLFTFVSTRRARKRAARLEALNIKTRRTFIVGPDEYVIKVSFRPDDQSEAWKAILIALSPRTNVIGRLGPDERSLLAVQSMVQTADGLRIESEFWAKPAQNGKPAPALLLIVADGHWWPTIAQFRSIKPPYKV
ncbi:MAG: hypothetical protein J7521_14100 [Caulobacter sp.]|nr:hypothetical protein [Caulobacter sp.]